MKFNEGGNQTAGSSVVLFEARLLSAAFYPRRYALLWSRYFQNISNASVRLYLHILRAISALQQKQAQLPIAVFTIPKKYDTSLVRSTVRQEVRLQHFRQCIPSRDYLSLLVFGARWLTLSFVAKRCHIISYDNMVQHQNIDD